MQGQWIGPLIACNKHRKHKSEDDDGKNVCIWRGKCLQTPLSISVSIGHPNRNQALIQSVLPKRKAESDPETLTALFQSPLEPNLHALYLLHVVTFVACNALTTAN